MIAAPDFEKCPCGGRFDTRLVEVRMTSRDGPVTLNDIPQGVCGNCGSRVYRRATLTQIEAVYRTCQRSLHEDASR